MKEACIMKQSEFTFTSSNGITPVAGYVFEPQTPPVAVLQLSHGMCEYVLRYLPMLEMLTDNGVAVIANDHIGHGRSVCDKTELGFFAAKDGWKCLVEDLHTVTAEAKKRFPGLPIILLGHSMGSFVARAYLNKYGRELSGAVISGTAGKNPLAGAGMAIARLTAAFKGAHHPAALVKKLSFGGYTSRFSDVRSPNDWLTKDREVVAKYDADPLCSFTFTASAYQDLMNILAYVNTREGAEGVPTDLPMYFVSGADDPVGNYGRGVAESVQLYSSLGCAVSMKLYDGDRHELHNELDKDTYFSDLMAFIGGIVEGK